jgi:hypothetical protein
MRENNIFKFLKFIFKISIKTIWKYKKINLICFLNFASHIFFILTI